jgi:small subunit ribosomal protein S15e
MDFGRLLDLSSEQLRDVVHARARRRFNRGLKRKPMGLIKKLRKSKQEAKPNEKPDLVKTHLRDMIVVPEMIGSVIGVYSGKVRSYLIPLGWTITHEYAGIQPGRNQARNGRPLPRRVLHHIVRIDLSNAFWKPLLIPFQQASQAWSARYWCYPLFSFHSSQVNYGVMGAWLHDDSRLNRVL